MRPVLLVGGVPESCCAPTTHPTPVDLATCTSVCVCVGRGGRRLLLLLLLLLLSLLLIAGA